MIRDPLQLILALTTVLAIASISFLTKVMDIYGFVSGFFIGLVILLFGGWSWFTVLLAFFVSASLLTRYKSELKYHLGIGEGGATRSWENVIANGSVAALFAVGYGFTSFTPFALGYLGAIGTATADTFATEVGLLNPYEPRLITDLSRKVPAGTSGAISPYGEIASLLGAGLVSSIAVLTNFPALNKESTFLIVVTASFMGSTFDSLLGATAQACYRCTVCGSLTEKRVHCNAPTAHFYGKRFIDNNLVNLLATTFGGVLASGLYIIVHT
ncbi:MAG: DUF92 domain-containing protein [Candidatus Bathyarchaeia archaeon]